MKYWLIPLAVIVVGLIIWLVLRNGDSPSGEGSCIPYNTIFKSKFPEIYSWQFDDQDSTYNCDSGTDYTVVFYPEGPNKVTTPVYVDSGEGGTISFTFENRGTKKLWLSAIGYTFTPTRVRTTVIPKPMDGYLLISGRAVTFTGLPKNWESVKIWPRTGCKQVMCAIGKDTDCWSCDTGDCSSSQNNWGRSGMGGQPNCWNGDQTVDPTGGSVSTSVELTLQGQKSNSVDFYDISAVDGVTIPVAVIPSKKDCKNCANNLDPRFKCGAPSMKNIETWDWCPPELTVTNDAGEITGCWSTTKIINDQDRLAYLYNTAKKAKKPSSLTRFVDALDLQRQYVGDYPSNDGYSNPKCSTDKDCPPLTKKDGNTTSTYPGFCDYVHTGSGLEKHCIVNPGCRSSSSCKRINEDLDLTSPCPSTCTDYHYYPKDATPSFENPYGRSKLFSKISCDCGCDSKLVNGIKPDLVAKGICSDRCCGKDCYAGCSDILVNKKGEIAYCPGNSTDTLSNHKEQTCRKGDPSYVPCYRK